MKKNTTALIKKSREELLKNAKALVETYNSVPVTVDCVIFGFDENELKVLLIRADLEYYNGMWSLLGELMLPHETLDEAAYRILKERTGMDDVYLDQVGDDQCG